jgi:hypothetical protein
MQRPLTVLWAQRGLPLAVLVFFVLLLLAVYPLAQPWLAQRAALNAGNRPV